MRRFRGCLVEIRRNIGKIRTEDTLLTVKTPEEAVNVIYDRFPKLTSPALVIETTDALGRVLDGDVFAGEFVPGFDRSMVDGYAVRASDTFGCSDSIPAVLTLAGEVLMGQAARAALAPGTCVAVSTGGDLPEGADAVVMLEHIEDYKDGLIGIMSPAAPGNNIIFKGDDVSPGDKALTDGTVISPYDIGILSALGRSTINVRPRPVVGVISTGDELVSTTEIPGRGQIRDVNTPMLLALMEQFGAEAKNYGIVRDSESELTSAIALAGALCDVTLISGGSSAGTRDMTARVIGALGEILFHGIAMKPGKPTILGAIGSKPVFGLPGHPVAAWFVTELFVRPLIARLAGNVLKRRIVTARLSEAISSNHGRAEYIPVELSADNSGTPDREYISALPIKSKSGLISSLASADGYICIPRDVEGIARNMIVTVTLFT